MRCSKCNQFYASGEPVYQMSDGAIAHVECPVQIETVTSYKKPDPEVQAQVMKQFTDIFENPDAPWNKDKKEWPEIIE